jgi:hypothetical protein
MIGELAAPPFLRLQRHIAPLRRNIATGKQKTRAPFIHIFKGSLTRDFRLQVFFMNQCPPGSQVFHWSLYEFFRKFAEIFAN